MPTEKSVKVKKEVIKKKSKPVVKYATVEDFDSFSRMLENITSF